jgi:dTDP-4-amino-4,6-dideoxygalactose transaminase
MVVAWHLYYILIKPEGRGSSPDEVIGFLFSMYQIYPASLWPLRLTQSLNRNEHEDLPGV